MIERFDCDNWRNVSCRGLRFRRINLLIGPNNCGKSNLLRALSFASDMMEPGLAGQSRLLAALGRNGLNGALDRRGGAARQSFEIAWRFRSGLSRPLAYKIEVHLGDHPGDDYFLEESLDCGEEGGPASRNCFSCHKRKRGMGEFFLAGAAGGPGRRIEVPVDGGETVLAQIDGLFPKNQKTSGGQFPGEAIASLRECLGGFRSYSSAAFDIAAVRSPQKRHNDDRALAGDGSNFIDVYRSFCETDRTFPARFSSMLGRVIEGLEEIRVGEAGGRIRMDLRIGGVWHPLAGMGDGAVRMAALMLLLSLPEDRRPVALALEEPEANLHPAWQKTLASAILRMRGPGQIFISTHSPDFLDEFTEGFIQDEVALIVFDPRMRNGIHNLDKKDFEGGLGEFTLGDLYRVGDPLIGGWPR